MSFEACLVRGTRLVVAVSHVLLQFLIREEFVLVCEDLLVPGAKVAHAFAMYGLDVSVEIRPSIAGKVAVVIGAVVSEQQDGIANNVFVRVLDPDVGVGCGDVLAGKLFETLVSVVGEDDERCRGL